MRDSPMGTTKDTNTDKKVDDLIDSDVCAGQLQQRSHITKKVRDDKGITKRRPNTDVTWTMAILRPIPRDPVANWIQASFPMMTEYRRVADGHVAIVSHGCEQEAVIDTKG